MLNWLWKLPDYLQHSVIAAGFMAAFGCVAWALGQPNPHWLGALAGVIWFHGREVADADSINRGLLDNWRVLWPGSWDADSRSDFLAPLASNTALAVIVEIIA